MTEISPCAAARRRGGDEQALSGHSLRADLTTAEADQGAGLAEQAWASLLMDLPAPEYKSFARRSKFFLS